MKKGKFERGFTMVELLVVIAILVVLAALIFAGASKAMKAAHSAGCTNNLRQIGTTIYAISAEGIQNGHNGPGTLPAYAGQISGPGIQWRKFTIYELIAEQAGFAEFRDKKYRWTVLPSDTFLQNPLSSYKLAGSTKEASAVSNDSFKKEGGLGSFGYNHRVGQWAAPHTEDPTVTRLATVDYPTLTILMAEQNRNLTGGGIWMGPYPNRFPEGEYQEKARCLFIDGHVEAMDNKYLASDEGKKKHYIPGNVKFE